MANLEKILSTIETDSDGLCFEKRPEVLAAYRDKLKYINNSGIFRKKIIDLGGGLDIFNGLLTDLGNDVSVFDILEFDDAWMAGDKDFSITLKKKLKFLKERGVKFYNKDVIQTDLREYYELNSVDVINSFHCLEHLHQSPKKVLESAIAVLKPGGSIIIEVPNSLNLIKRIKVFLGYTNYIPFAHYFNAELFTGHVREYSVGDLQQLSNQIDMVGSNIVGRNFFGALYTKFGYNLITKSSDKLLRSRPGLCGSLFLVWVKPPS
jgi:SAM-dependent methyltransferase